MFTYQMLGTRFPIPDHQLIAVVVVVNVIVYEQYSKVVPADPDRIHPADVGVIGNSPGVFKSWTVLCQRVCFTRG
jgi:hypothetical protein